jgi:3-oxoacyl-[acyl-carrier protein] reductase
VAQKIGTSFEEEYETRKARIPAKRYGNPEEFGELCAFLCSAQAGYITGQNIVIDGGNYPGTL